MGVPAFFRWLTRKYPSVVIECIEEQPVVQNGEEVEVDSSKQNPNGIEFDNFYIDMNGIIHPCTHPENKPPPQDENEMMIAIFECIDRLFKIVRPRKVLYMAIDGVAPRAKMNQQRSRRFRAAKDSKEKTEQIESIRAELELRGINLPQKKDKSYHFDSNCITPGTEFMHRLTECLNYYIHKRLTNDSGWKGLKVILSDASVPGEGEHKIMDFIRRQRALPNHDPNTKHCLCGADADLIMLGLATHEPHFTIIREEFIMNNTKRCDICAQTGHEMKDCKGLPNTYDDFNEIPILPISQTKYIFVRLNVLREYLEEELSMPGLPFEYNFERALDDWVFMCFFVGNDFLPHLPSLEIREGAIDRLVNLYKRTVYRTGGFITDSGDVNLERVQLILNDLAAVEDEIFRKRQKNDIMFKMRNRQRKMQERRMLSRENEYKTDEEILAQLEMEDPDPVDNVKLWQSGYKERYYQLKFDLKPSDKASRYRIGFEYAIGLCWVLKYYYQGCASWKWFYPYHYAPFASDIVDIASRNIEFERHTQPFSPLEQLMGVFPAASSSLVPSAWADLMVNPNSPVLDFYPKDFMVDLNGKKLAWQGVALLPFVDEERLRKALSPLYSDLTKEEVERNTRGNDRLYVAPDTDCYNFINDSKVENKKDRGLKSLGVCGNIILKNDCYQGTIIISPIPKLPEVSDNKIFCVRFCDPVYPDSYKFLAQRLPGAKDPPKTRGSDNEQGNRPRPVIGMTQRHDEATITNAGHRILRHNLPRQFAQALGQVTVGYDDVGGNIHTEKRSRGHGRGRWNSGYRNTGAGDRNNQNMRRADTLRFLDQGATSRAGGNVRYDHQEHQQQRSQQWSNDRNEQTWGNSRFHPYNRQYNQQYKGRVDSWRGYHGPRN